MLRNRILPRSLVLVVLAAAVTAGSAVAARGGKPPAGTPASAEFRDLEGDGIQSDGLGPYDAVVDNDIIIVSTGKSRALWLDFSSVVSGIGESPFGQSDSGTINNATLDVYLQYGVAVFHFNANGGKYMLSVDVEVSTYDDGTTRRYAIEPVASANHALVKAAPRGGRGQDPSSPHDWNYVGSFAMPWGLDVIVD